MVWDFSLCVFILFNYSRPVSVHILSFNAWLPGAVENTLKWVNSFCTGNKDMIKTVSVTFSAGPVIALSEQTG